MFRTNVTRVHTIIFDSKAKLRRSHDGGAEPELSGVKLARARESVRKVVVTVARVICRWGERRRKI